MRVEEALERVDKYLDDAVIAAMPYAKLCHGAGTGALSKAVREFLATHPHVTGWRYGRPPRRRRRRNDCRFTLNPPPTLITS